MTAGLLSGKEDRLGAAIHRSISLEQTGLDLADHALAGLLAQQDEMAFERVFKEHFKSLHAYACTLLNDEANAEEMVQQVFFKLWDRAAHLQIAGSVAAYLYRSVHNECLNFLKHQKVKARHQLHVAYRAKEHDRNAQDAFSDPDLALRIREALESLPEQCRTIFQLSRFEDLKYREIADRLQLSVKTVENQMGKALRIMRAKLIEFISLLLFIINH